MKNIFFALIVLLTPLASQAGEQELYDAVPPSDSAFVRFINADSAAKPLMAAVASTKFDNVEYADVTAYAVVKQGKHNVSFGDIKENLEFTAGKYYTIANNKAKLLILDDKTIENPAKAMIYFYNLSDSDNAALFSTTHKADIFKDIKASETTAREINALTFGVTVKLADKEIQSFENVELKRRTGTSFIVVGKAGNYKASFADGSIAKQ